MHGDSISQVKEELVARAETRTLDELQAGGRRRVRMIRPADIDYLRGVREVADEFGLLLPTVENELQAEGAPWILFSQTRFGLGSFLSIRAIRATCASNGSRLNTGTHG